MILKIINYIHQNTEIIRFTKDMIYPIILVDLSLSKFFLIMLLINIFFVIFFNNDFFYLKKISLFIALYIFFFYIRVYFDLNHLSLSNFLYFQISDIFGDIINIDYSICIDNISYIFLLLTSILFPLCLLIGWNNIFYHVKYYYFIFIILEFILINVFMTNNIIMFYFFFESVLIPMYLLIGQYGSRDRRIFAAYQFLLYTLFGSLFVLIALLFLQINFGSTELYYLLDVNLSPFSELLIWSLFFFGL